MKALLFTLTVLAFLEVFQCTDGLVPQAVSTKTLTRLSLEGEKLVDEEVQKALYGIKHMKEVMTKNEIKHEHLMRSLHNSGEKKKQVNELAKNMAKKMDEAEQQCKETPRSFWKECHSCLEDICKNFYTNNCRRGFATFSSKLEDFYRRVSSRFELHGTQEEASVTGSTESPDLELIKIEDLFSNITSKVNILVNRSMPLVFSFHRELDKVLHQAFAPESQQEEETEGLDLTFLQGVGLEKVLDSLIDITRGVVEEFGAVVTRVLDDLHGVPEEAQKKHGLTLHLLERHVTSGFLQSRKLCKNLRRQSSECRQLRSKCQACQGTLFSECPSMWELHVEQDEISELLDIAKEQYEEVLATVQRHTDDTISWLTNMVAQFGWVAELAADGTIPENIFSISAVVTPDGNDPKEETPTPAADTKVEVNVLNAPTLTLTVPGTLQPQDPAFIQYVANEALGFYKKRIRLEDA